MRLKSYVLGVLSGIAVSGIVAVLLFALGVFGRIEPSPFRYYYDNKEITFPADNESIVYKNQVYVPLERYSKILEKGVSINEKNTEIMITSYVPELTDPSRPPLNRKDFDFITIGMSGSAVRGRVGLPQRTIGDNFTRDAYSLDDGSSMIIYYGAMRTEGVQGLYIVYPDGHQEGIFWAGGE